ncbi:GNAT family N-acetyltransferase [Paenibacillus cymbidii]|uniref:GNAT family N-acetyltransferase n=1 Tax=Paenibacillus cymbidii TaxID=1639034 RepID=UPI00108073F9|nr:GNAT family N-acetyltransferase [Paenibacillus cymbidii]
MQVIQTGDAMLLARLNKDVHELHVSLYPQYFKEYRVEEILEFFSKATGDSRFLFFVLEDNGKYFGYAWVEIKEYRENAFMKAYRSVFVHQLSIGSEHRGKGLGSLLMNTIYELAASRGIRRIELDYWADNHSAASFYDKQGFQAYRTYVFKDLED